MMPNTHLAMDEYTGANAPGWPYTKRDQDPQKVHHI
jgi:hypothetical protein